MLEIERKFLLPPCKAKKYLKKLGCSYTKRYIIQYYTENARFRKIDNNYYRTLKRGHGMIREEIEESITEKDFYAHIDRKYGKKIEKLRYIFNYKGQTYEMDEFKGALKGLLYLEIEFDTLQSAQNFELPKRVKKIILDEVTNNVTFSNRSLALEGLPVFDTPLEELSSKIQAKTPLSATLQLQFHPFENTYAVLKVWVSKLTDTIEANKMAIIKGDVDSERLHQLRVALRKLRSVLTLLAKHLQITEAKELAKLAKEVMRNTNEARDLDVYLEWLTEYEQMLPTKLTSSLQTLKESLQKERNEAYNTLLDVLQSPEFSLLLSRLHSFASSEPTQKAPSIILGKWMLIGQLNSVWEKACRLTPKSKPHKYHLVRIEIKKLRYLIEFFSFIFKKERYKDILATVKTMQDILGEHQDTTVQLEYIETMLHNTLSEDQKEALLFLYKTLEHRAKKLRKKFRKRSIILKALHKQLKRGICRF